jgi:hypothetical protein
MKEIITLTLVGIVLLVTGYCLGKLDTPTVQNVFPPKYHTEDMAPVNYSANRIVIQFADSVRGRPAYNVLFSDTTVLDSMYPEEIANGLATGKWLYNEDLKLK